jgi:hypothetical protein
VNGGIALWGLTRPVQAEELLRGALLRLGAVALAAGAIVGVVLGVVGAPRTLAALLATAVVVLALVVLVVAGVRERRPPGVPVRLDRREEVLVATTVEGIEPLLGLGATQVAVIEGAVPNATLVPGARREPLLVLTRGVLELDPLELEALVVRTLVPWRLGLARAMAIADLADRLLGRRTRRDDRHRRLAWELDVATCSLTRYPPALVSVLRRLAEASPVEVPGLSWWLWTVAGDQRAELEARADALEDEPWATRRSTSV